MPVVFGVKEAEDRIRVQSITFTINKHPDGYTAPEPPPYPPPEIGIRHVQYYNPQTKEYFYEEEPRELTPEEQTQVQLQNLQEAVEFLVLDALARGDIF